MWAKPYKGSKKMISKQSVWALNPHRQFCFLERYHTYKQIKVWTFDLKI